MHGPFTWHVALADLSLILFLLTASALAEEEDQPAAVPFVETNASAIYSGDHGAESFQKWLDENANDSRLSLTIYVSYNSREGPIAAAQRAQEMAQVAQQYEGEMRIVIVRRNSAPSVVAVLSFDDDERMAQSLLGETEEPTNGAS